MADGEQYVAGPRGTILPNAANPFHMGVTDKMQDIRDAVVIVDPQSSHKFELRLDTLQSEAVFKATQAVLTEGKTASTKETASAVLKTIANNARAAVQAQQPSYQQQNVSPVGMGVSQNMASPVQRVTPMLALPGTAGAQQTSPFTQPNARYDQPEQPAKQVVFEYDNFGELTAAYHDVIIDDSLIVLVHDSRQSSQIKYFPQFPKTEQRMAMNVVGTDMIYLFQPTGVQFKHNDFEYYVLMIVKAFSTNQG